MSKSISEWSDPLDAAEETDGFGPISNPVASDEAGIGDVGAADLSVDLPESFDTSEDPVPTDDEPPFAFESGDVLTDPMPVFDVSSDLATSVTDVPTASSLLSDPRDLGDTGWITGQDEGAGETYFGSTAERAAARIGEVAAAPPPGGQAALQGLDDPSLSYNLAGIVDYSAQMPFLDVMKMSRPWLGHENGQYGGLEYDEMVEMGLLDENGYPTSMPDGVTHIEALWDWENSADDPGLAQSRSGTYVITWEGEGELFFSGSGEIISQEDNQIVFSNPTGGFMYLGIRSTDPNGTGDYIRDISVVKEEHVELHEAGAVFNPDWLELVNDSRQFRFMDWMNTNNSDVVDWEERKTVDSATWEGGSSVPVEVLVQLANEAGVDPWFTFPHGASDEYIAEFTAYVRDNLDPNLTATFELSNEAWNWIFEQTHYFNEQASEMWGDTMYGFPDLYSAYAKRAVEMAQIVEGVFEGEPDARMQTTLGMFTGYYDVNDRILNAPSWRDSGDPNYVPPHEVFDTIAVTSYFGGITVIEDELLANLRAAIDDPAVDAEAWLAERLQDPG